MEIMQMEKEDLYLVDTKSLRKMLGCCHNTAVKIGMAAGARVQIGSMVRWRVRDINKFLDSLQGGKQ